MSRPRIETEVLLEEMEWCGIQGALIAHSLGKEYTPDWGNRQLLQELKKSPRLYGVWSVMPHHTGEMAPPRDVIQQMRDNNIRAAKMYPRVHHYFFNEDSCGELLSALEEEEILLILEGGGMYNPDIMDPANQVLLTRTRCDDDTASAAAGAAPEFALGCDAVSPHADDEASPVCIWNSRITRATMRSRNIAGWFGVERLLFGTGRARQIARGGEGIRRLLHADRMSRRC